MRAAVLAWLALLLAGAYTPPPLQGHVVDTTGRLTADQVRDLDMSIDALGNDVGFALVVLVTELGGESIEDIAYTAFNTWGIGEKGKDNGVLLVIAPTERRTRIETGKGIGGALPDLRTNDILRQSVAPHLAEGNLETAIEGGAIAIANTLRGDTSWKRTDTRARSTSSSEGTSLSPAMLVIGGVVLVLLLVVSRRRGRKGFGGGGPWWGGFGGGGFGGFGGGGGGRSSGSGYTGGGGRSGGGGSNSSY